MRVWIGWEASGLVDKGSFIVDRIEHSGAPDQMTIGATSADLKAELGEKKEASFHAKTFGDIIRHVAKAHGLEPVIRPASLAGEALSHTDQTGESDANLLTRLAEMFDAIVTVKSGKLLVFLAGEAMSATGQALPSITIDRAAGDSHRFSITDRDNFAQVEASYEDKAGAKKGTVLVDANQGPDIQQTGEGKKVLRHVYANKSNATRAARAAARKVERDVAQFSITLARGRPDIFPEIPVTISGFKSGIDGAGWIVAKATHTLSADGGLSTNLDLEMKPND